MQSFLNLKPINYFKTHASYFRMQKSLKVMRLLLSGVAEGPVDKKEQIVSQLRVLECMWFSVVEKSGV